MRRTELLHAQREAMLAGFASKRGGLGRRVDAHLPYDSRLDPAIWEAISDLDDIVLGPQIGAGAAYNLNELLNRVLQPGGECATSIHSEEGHGQLLDVQAPEADFINALRLLGWKAMPSAGNIRLHALRRVEAEHVDCVIFGDRGATRGRRQLADDSYQHEIHCDGDDCSLDDYDNGSDAGDPDLACGAD